MQLTTKDYVDKGLNSPAFTGTPTAPTAGAGCDTRQIATCEFVQNAISGVSEGLGNIGVYKKSGITVGALISGRTWRSIGGLTKTELLNLADDGYDLCILEYEKNGDRDSITFMLRSLRSSLSGVSRVELESYRGSNPFCIYIESANDVLKAESNFDENYALTLTAYKVSNADPINITTIINESASDANVPTSKAVKDYVDAQDASVKNYVDTKVAAISSGYCQISGAGAVKSNSFFTNPSAYKVTVPEACYVKVHVDFYAALRSSASGSGQYNCTIKKNRTDIRTCQINILPYTITSTTHASRTDTSMEEIIDCAAGDVISITGTGAGTGGGVSNVIFEKLNW